MAYTLKFAFKLGAQGIDYRVPPLEGLWWSDDSGQLNLDDGGSWRRTAMIAQPDFVTAEHVAEAVAAVEKKRHPAALPRVRLEAFQEGLSAQIMHVGPYSAERPTIERLHAFVEESGYRPRGKHHEIYLGDPRRAAPEKPRTVIRQPVMSPS